MKTDNARTLKIDIRALGYDSGTRNRRSRGGAAFEGIDYRYMFENSYDAVVVTGTAGDIQAYNERALSFFGYEEAAEFDRLTIHALIAGFTDSLLGNIVAVVQERRYMRMQAFAIRKDETFCAVEIIVMGANKDSAETICYTIRDIQARHHASRRCSPRSTPWTTPTPASAWSISTATSPTRTARCSRCSGTATRRA